MTLLEFRLYFDGSFWQAQLERRSNNTLQIAQHCFGAEPPDAEALQWYLDHANRIRFSLPFLSSIQKKQNNFTQMRRSARRTLKRAPVTEEIRQLAHLVRQERRLKARKLNKTRREADEQLRRKRTKDRQKQRHRGR